MATTVSLEGSVRTTKGKGVARKLRRAARIPGVLYGKTREPLKIDLDGRAFTKLVSEHSASNLIIDLQVGDEKEVTKTLIGDMQFDPLSGAVLHVDFKQILLTDTIEVEIPIELIGVAIGVKDFGGILQHPIRTVTIKCLPQDMPEKISIDVTALEIGQSIMVSSLDIANVEILTDGDQGLATVIPPTKIEETVVEVEGDEEGVGDGEPEVVGKEKKEGEEDPEKKKDEKKKDEKGK